MANVINIQVIGAPVPISGLKYTIWDNSNPRNIILQGDDFELDEVGMGSIDVDSTSLSIGDTSLVKIDSFDGTNGNTFGGAHGIGIVSEITVDWSVVLVDLSSIPEASWFTTDNTVYADGSTTYKTADTLATFTGTHYYVGYAGASDSNDGLSEGTSWASVGHAMQNVPSSSVVNINTGDYWLGGWDSVSATNGAAYVGANGPVNIWAGEEDSSAGWVVDGTYPNTYVLTGQAYSVWDASVDNPYWTEHNTDMPNLGWMTKQTSIVDVESNPGSWYFDGTDLYVQTHDSRVPDIDIKVISLDDLRIGVDNDSEYWQGISFVGYEVETYAFRDNATISFYQCNFGYTHSDNLVTARGRTECYIYMEDCFAFSTYRDAFSSRQSPYVVMINCVGGDAPISGSNNATTSHDDGNMIRLGGTYYDSGYLVLADIQSGLSLNVAVHSYKTYAGDSNSADFYFLDCIPYMIRCSNEVDGGSESQLSISGTNTVGVQGNTVTGLQGSGITLVEGTYYEEPAL